MPRLKSTEEPLRIFNARMNQLMARMASRNPLDPASARVMLHAIRLYAEAHGLVEQEKGDPVEAPVVPKAPAPVEAASAPAVVFEPMFTSNGE